MLSKIAEYFFEAQQVPVWAKDKGAILDQNDLETEFQDDFSDDTDEMEEDIVGASFGIEYTSSKGEKSERDISITKVKVHNGYTSLMAYCFVKERVRQFRLDRITSVFDIYGEVHEPKEFFAIYGLSYKSAPLPENKPATKLKARMRDEARILVALARIDGNFHNSELDEILIYSVKKLENSGEMQSDDDIDAYEKYIKNLYPTPEVIDKCVDKLKKYTDKGKNDFIEMCVKVMNADMHQHTKEVELILEIKNELFLC